MDPADAGEVVLPTGDEEGAHNLPDDALDWEWSTAQFMVEYARLYFQYGAVQIPVVPIATDTEDVVLGLPAEMLPWLPPVLVVLADPETGAPADDVGVVTICVVALGRAAVCALHVSPPGTVGTWVPNDIFEDR